MTESQPQLSAVTGSSGGSTATATSPGAGSFMIARNGGTLTRSRPPACGHHCGRRNRTW